MPTIKQIQLGISEKSSLFDTINVSDKNELFEKLSGKTRGLINSDTQLTSWGEVISVDARSTNVIIILPPSFKNQIGNILSFKRIDDVSANTVDIVSFKTEVYAGVQAEAKSIKLKPGGSLKVRCTGEQPAVIDWSSPYSISRFWLPSDGSTAPTVWYDFSDLSNLNHSLGKVSAIKNKGSLGVNYDLVQTTSSNQPLLDSIVSPTKAKFVATNFLKNSTAQPFFATGTTITYVMMYQQAGSGTTVPFGSDNATNRIQCHPQWNDAQATTYVDFGSVAGGRISASLSGAASGTEPHTFIGIRNGATGNLYLDGDITASITGSTLSGTQPGTTFISIGAQSNDNSNPLTGDIYECLGYAVAISATEKDKLAAYMAWKSGKQSILHSSNPYKNLRPLQSIATY